MSNQANGESPDVRELDASKLIITPCREPRSLPELSSPEVWAQNVASDHMVTCRWTSANGWESPHLQPYGPLSLMPTASVLHYATECFEGMKAFRGFDGKLRLFRPEKNCARMRKSAARIALPQFNPLELEKLIKKLVAVDGPKWLPESRKGTFIYLRPTMIASSPALGVQRPREALLYLIAVMMPSYDGGWGSKGNTAETTKLDVNAGMKLLTSSPNVHRAWPGGMGNAKVGGNYGPTLVAQEEARTRGFDQVLWLYGEHCEVTEAGGSNFFVVWKTPEGTTQLVTAPLDDGIILEGITRESVLEFAREQLSSPGDDGMASLEVVERKYTMDELVKASEEGRLLEAFGCGTAFFISPTSTIHFRGKDIHLSLAYGREVKYAARIRTFLADIMYGKVLNHPWVSIIDEEGAPQ